MSEAIKASKNRPARFSEPSRVFTSHVQNIKEDVVRVKAQLCSTFPTDQVPQPVPRDTIVLTRMAAPTDFRGAACLPQSAPTVQAQVNSTGCVITCDDCTQATFYQYQRGPTCPVDPRGDRAGPLVALQPLSVIPSSSCPASARPLLTSSQVVSMSTITSLTAPKPSLNPILSITATCSFVSVYPCSMTSTNQQQSSSHIPINPVILSGGSSILKSNNKMQSVNVNCSLAVNKYKGNKINFSSETAVTEPNTTEPQRNITVEEANVDVTSTGIDNVVVQPNNNSYNSVKLLELVKVNVKNVNKYGALILFPNDDDYQYKANKQYIPDIDIPVILLLPIVQGNKYSNYYPPKCSFKNNTKKLFEIDEYASNFAESESKSGIIHQQHNTIHTSNDIQSNTCEFHNDFINMTTNHTINTTSMSITNAINNKHNNNIYNNNTNVAASASFTVVSTNNDGQNDQYYTFSQLIEQQNEAQIREKQWIRLHGGRQIRLRLCGGGESSLNTGTSGWGTPPAANSNNNNGNNTTGWGSTAASQNPNNQNNWNNNSTRNNATGPGQGPPISQDASNTNKSANSNANLSQNANPNQPPTSQTAGNQGWNQNNANKTATNNPGPNPTGPANPTNTVAPTTTSTKQQLEQLNSMREALFSQDGWGGQHVNQDTNWDIPSSPEPGQKEGPGGTPIWKPPVNNGTELWEANLRNGGQPPAQPVQKTPWGHTPTTNIGGTWGEEDDVSDSSNVWTGVPNNQQQWGGGQGQNNSNAMWGGPKKENDWGNNGTGGNNSGWGDPRSDPRAAAMDPREAAMRPTSMDPRNSGTGAADPRESLRMIGGDPMRDGMRDPRDLRGIPDMRGDPRGISGRLNGEGMWGAPPHPPHQMSHHQPPGKMVGPAPNGVNQWSGPPPKEIGMNNKQSGWEEPSPPSQRRTMPNFDDGTSLWGNPTQQPNRMPASGKLSHWTDLPSGGPMGNRGGNACPPGMVGGNRKPPADGSLWGRNGSWGDDAQPHWSEEAWSKPKAPPVAWDSEIDWNKPGPKLTKEHVWNSKQFRHLVEMGYKKEDAENALRLRDMNLDDALDILSPLRPSVDTWRNSTGGSANAVGRHDEHSGYDHANAGPYAQRFGPGGPGQIQFPPGGNAPNLINNMGGSGGNPSIPSINNMSPAVVQKILQASGGTNAGSAAVTNIPGYGATGSQARSQPPPAQSQPSTQQLRMLVQQIQMAVQAGYLNHQILNQPLAPQTLILLNQLLQHIKLLQTLMNQLQVFQSQSLGKPNSQAILQVNVNIAKTKQQISNLQNQIAANQAIYVKQMGGGGGGGGTGQDFFKTNMHDPISALQGNFSDLSLNKEPPTSYTSQQQSRLQQWIKPDKEDTTGEFSRAPGSIAKPPVAHSSPSMNLGLGQSDGPWSTGRSNDTGGWPDSGTDGPDGAGKDAWPSAQPSPAAFLDVVPEFEPGKPWKGNQMKSIEDDPTITPGSVVRSPLSLATIKDTEIFSAPPPSTVPSKASPPVEPLSISSSTWSFNPISTTSFTSPLNKIGATKGTWDITPQPTAELWGAPMGKRGPPPGLVKGGIGGSNATTNGWSGIGGGARSASGAWGSSANWGSSWLLLRNLTAQIDGSTLQTLCKQHGPLQSFHLYSNHGFALAKYSSREEAIKAQTALNNCVLGNTTILAESPGDSDVNTLMQSLAQQSGSSGGGWRGGGGGGTKGAPGANLNAGADTWGNACWPPNPTPTASLWGAPPSTMDSDTQRATPSSLNSYLPGDLLGGESM